MKQSLSTTYIKYHRRKNFSKMILYKGKQDLEENKNRTLLQSHAKTEFLTVVGQSVLWSYEQNACCLPRCSPKGYKLEIHARFVWRGSWAKGTLINTLIGPRHRGTENVDGPGEFTRLYRMDERWSETKSEQGGGWEKEEKKGGNGERLWRKKEVEKERKSEGQFAEARRLITSQLRTPDIHN